MPQTVAINIVDLYYSREDDYDKAKIIELAEIIKFIYDNFPRDKICIADEKDIKKKKYMKAIQDLFSPEIELSPCNCNYESFMKDDRCTNCISVEKHESHYVVCCLGKGVDAVLTVKCGCDKFREGIKNECIANGIFNCKDIESTRCWVLCT
ncbi:hypothetical protein VMUT_1493 [Vulcanisaeta moutnovskia 768-28]|uniref:Uncharacterized protein n=1 Tax=Vulcanisaeta moutnovskia (strain 768-28) TaxID=985053 RepID=F0QTI5_VULM7|nr:hypothetical protein [Vulcanisaeta moutnovskia]ADY01698.1 hypothetical protein VMUT_1493 [Vulcanisaeta moutnovskia 768-28]